MTKTELAQAKRDLKAAQADLKSLLARVGDDLGCDGTDEETKLLRGTINGLLADIAEAGDRKPLESAVWAKAHRDSRGYLGGAPCRENRSILLYGDGKTPHLLSKTVILGTFLARLSDLTIAELLAKL